MNYRVLINKIEYQWQELNYFDSFLSLVPSLNFSLNERVDSDIKLYTNSLIEFYIEDFLLYTGYISSIKNQDYTYYVNSVGKTILLEKSYLKETDKLYSYYDKANINDIAKEISSQCDIEFKEDYKECELNDVVLDFDNNAFQVLNSLCFYCGLIMDTTEKGELTIKKIPKLEYLYDIDCHNFVQHQDFDRLYKNYYIKQESDKGKIEYKGFENGTGIGTLIYPSHNIDLNSLKRLKGLRELSSFYFTFTMDEPLSEDQYFIGKGEYVRDLNNYNFYFVDSINIVYLDDEAKVYYKMYLKDDLAKVYEL